MAAAAAVLLLAVLGLAAGAWLLWQEQRRTDAERRHAEARLRTTRRAVDEMYTGFASRWRC